jgi:hypothetical protein
MYRLCDKFLLSVAVMYTFVLIYRILFISVRNTQINTPQNHVINILFWYVDKSWKSKKNYSWKFSVQREITCIFNLSLEFYDSFQLISSENCFPKVAGHGENMSKMTILKGGADGFSYFSLLSDILFSNQDNP